MLTWLPFSADSAAMVVSAQKVKVAVKSAKIGASSHVANSILKNAAKWLVYASTVTFEFTRSPCSRQMATGFVLIPDLHYSHHVM